MNKLWKKLWPLLALPLVLCPLLNRPARASSADIVPRGSTLLDAFATLAGQDAFGAEDTPEDFLGEPLYTRGQLARLLGHLIEDEPEKFHRLQKDDRANTALHRAVEGLLPELRAGQVDIVEVDAVPAEKPSISGYVQPELRLRTGGDRDPGTGGFGLYRATVQGNLRPNLRYNVSAATWPQDRRRVFDNDLGTHDFSGLSEAYLTFDGGRGLKVDLGRKFERWGPGYRGATLLSDNAPAFDQVQARFPFSLGAHLGRSWRFTQLASTFEEGGERKYIGARRVEVDLNPRLTADFQEAFKSSTSRSLLVSFLPDFYTGQSANLKISGLRINGLDQSYNAILNFGLSYTAAPDTRFYGQFAIDDLQTPGRPTFRTPRKIAYLIGTAFRPAPGTDAVAEYTFADPTTYSSRIPDTQWQKGQYDQIGLPTGPNSREIFLRIRQRLRPGLHLAVSGRDRQRKNDSFPEPESRDFAATLEYAPNTRSGFEITYHDYRQTAFPLAPTVPVPGDGFTPANAEGYYGQPLRIKQIDFAYRLFF